MDILKWLLDFVLHLDKHLSPIIQEYGAWTYLLLFLIVFCETGLVVTPILPGDSLLFAAGAFAVGGTIFGTGGTEPGALDVTWLLLLLSVAAVLGDAVNYAVGNFMGPKVLSRDGRFLKKKYIDRTHQFYERHGGMTIILARFVPIVRTFAPFLAGVGTMTYWKFASYNIVGGILWVATFIIGGYFFGHLEFVQKNFTYVTLAIIGISVLPMVFEVWRARREPKTPA